MGVVRSMRRFARRGRCASWNRMLLASLATVLLVQKRVIAWCCVVSSAAHRPFVRLAALRGFFAITGSIARATAAAGGGYSARNRRLPRVRVSSYRSPSAKLTRQYCYSRYADLVVPGWRRGRKIRTSHSAEPNLKCFALERRCDPAVVGPLGPFEVAEGLPSLGAIVRRTCGAGMAPTVEPGRHRSPIRTLRQKNARRASDDCSLLARTRLHRPSPFRSRTQLSMVRLRATA